MESCLRMDTSVLAVMANTIVLVHIITVDERFIIKTSIIVLCMKLSSK